MHRVRPAATAAILIFVSASLAPLFAPAPAQAIPAFARANQMSCNACHAAFPRLNGFGEHFRNQGFRLPGWKKRAAKLGDNELNLPATLPLAIRAQGVARWRTGTEIDPETGTVGGDAETDLQSPYLIKLLSGTPLTDHVSFYAYVLFAEKGGNGEALVEDAWFRYDDVAGTGVRVTLGQFQVSDLMFPRETRMTFQDFMAYRLAGITYERGVLIERDAGPAELALGLVNGNGITAQADLNSPGIQRGDKLFDNNPDKSVFGRVGVDAKAARVGLFALSGKQDGAAGPAGLNAAARESDKRVVGLDASGLMAGNLYWFGQGTISRWEDFLAPGSHADWSAAFLGLDWIPKGPWAYSVLWNYADAGDFDGSDTIYEGIETNTVTGTAAYYFARNVKGVIEANVDLMSDKAKSGTYWTGHLDPDHYVLVGVDAAF
jgi:hypothetical protein